MTFWEHINFALKESLHDVLISLRNRCISIHKRSALEMSRVLESILGNRSATYVLLYLQYFGEGHALRMAKTFDVSPMGLQRQLNRLEKSGVLISRLVGRTRVFTFNETSPTVRSLRSFLNSELTLSPDMFKQPDILIEHTNPP